MLNFNQPDTKAPEPIETALTYFRQLPNVEYQNFLSENYSSQNYVLMKNIFIRGKLRDDLQNVLTIFNKYTIPGDKRPDQIADELYGDANLDWVVRVVGNIINLQNDFPLSAQELYEYCTKKYGEERVNGIKHYVTKEVRDNFNRLVLPAGQVVRKDFTIPDPNIPTSILNPTTGITNWDYETSVNDAKRTIYVLKPEYLGQFLADMRDISKYGFNSEFVNTKTIRTENTRNLSP